MLVIKNEYHEDIEFFENDELDEAIEEAKRLYDLFGGLFYIERVDKRLVYEINYYGSNRHLQN